jgi:hypothetical protein
VQTDTNLKILDSAVDWLTVTAKRGATADSLIALGDGLLHQSVDQGNRFFLFKSMGYHGRKAGGVSVGRRHDGCILTLTSSEAALSAIPLLGGEFHVTRLDLQITCVDESRNAARAEIAYHLMQDSRKRSGRPVSASLRLNSSGGQTLYLGSAKSDVVARLYDKGIESKAAKAGDCWRYEVQYRRKPATHAAGIVSQSEAHHDSIAALVTSHFTHRGVVVPDIEGGTAQHSGRDADSWYSRRESDDHRSLRWLNTFVASTVKRLVDSGKRAEVMRALGLDEVKQSSID